LDAILGSAALLDGVVCGKTVNKWSDALCLSRLQIPRRDTATFSVCSWSGWAEKDELGAELLKTHWLLSVSLLDKNKEWAATNVGQDVFIKVSSDPDERLLNDLDALKALRSKIASKRA
jgi:hypothetical protein